MFDLYPSSCTEYAARVHYLHTPYIRGITKYRNGGTINNYKIELSLHSRKPACGTEYPVKWILILQVEYYDAQARCRMSAEFPPLASK